MLVHYQSSGFHCKFKTFFKVLLRIFRDGKNPDTLGHKIKICPINNSDKKPIVLVLKRMVASLEI